MRLLMLPLPLMQRGVFAGVEEDTQVQDLCPSATSEKPLMPTTVVV